MISWLHFDVPQPSFLTSQQQQSVEANGSSMYRTTIFLNEFEIWQRA